MERELNSLVYKYIEELYSSHLTDLAQREDHHMQLSKVEGHIIHLLCKLIGAQSVLEVGTLHGYSTKFLSRAVGKTGKVVTIEKSKEAFDLAQQNLNGFDNVKCINADAIEYLKSLDPNSKFDVVFIDADKTNYSNYLDLCAPLLRSGGLLLADNTLMYGKIASLNPTKFREKTLNAIKLFNKKLVESPAYESIILPTTSGLTIALKK